MVVLQSSGGRRIFVEPERNLCLDCHSDIVVPGCAVRGTGRVQIDTDLGTGACLGAVNDFACSGI